MTDEQRLCDPQERTVGAPRLCPDRFPDCPPHCWPITDRPVEPGEAQGVRDKPWPKDRIVFWAEDLARHTLKINDRQEPGDLKLGRDTFFRPLLRIEATGPDPACVNSISGHLSIDQAKAAMLAVQHMERKIACR